METQERAKELVGYIYNRVISNLEKVWFVLQDFVLHLSYLTSIELSVF